MNFEVIFVFLHKKMNTFIKYKRFETVELENIQSLFDDLIKEGWEIIYYNEIDASPLTPFGIKIVVVAGKRHTTL